MAAAYWLSVHNGMTDMIYAHISACVPGEAGSSSSTRKAYVMSQHVVDDAVAMNDPTMIRRHGLMEWAAMRHFLNTRGLLFRD